MAANPDNKGLFGRGQYMKEYLVEWPKRQETYGEIEAMDAEIERLRQPVEGTLKLTLDGKPAQIRLGNLRYVETSMTAAEAKNAFAAAEL